MQIVYFGSTCPIILLCLPRPFLYCSDQSTKNDYTAGTYHHNDNGKIWIFHITSLCQYISVHILVMCVVWIKYCASIPHNGRERVSNHQPHESRLFTQPFIQTQIKENIKASRHWPLCGEFTGPRWIPAQMASNAENVSIWWRHYGWCIHTLINCNITRSGNELSPFSTGTKPIHKLILTWTISNKTGTKYLFALMNPTKTEIIGNKRVIPDGARIKTAK